jgi:hypothetical protein
MVIPVLLPSRAIRFVKGDSDGVAARILGEDVVKS